MSLRTENEVLAGQLHAALEIRDQAVLEKNLRTLNVPTESPLVACQ